MPVPGPLQHQLVAHEGGVTWLARLFCADGGKKAAAAAATATAGSEGGESWRPGFYLSRLLSSGSSGPETAGEGSSKAIVPAGPTGGEPNAA